MRDSREPHYGVTSLAELGRAVTMAQADAALRAAFETVFGPTCDTPQDRATVRLLLAAIRPAMNCAASCRPGHPKL